MIENSIQKQRWQKGVYYTKKFIEREGHARVPLRHVEDGFTLGEWVSAQRKTYKSGKLPGGRREALEALEGWTWDPHDAAWRKGLDHVKRFVEREGHARVPIKHVEDGFRLGQWVNNQRADYNRDELSPERREALKALDGWYSGARDAAWRKGLDHVRRFVEREGHARVQRRHVEDGFKLGEWVGTQRGTYKSGCTAPGFLDTSLSCGGPD